MCIDRRTLAPLIATLLVAIPARAQQANVDAQQFRPPATSGGILGLDSDRVAPHLALSSSLWVDWAHQPLVLRDASGRPLSAVVGDQLDFDVALAISLAGRVEVGMLVPVLAYQSVDQPAWPTALGLAQTAIGDIRFDGKVRLGELAAGGARVGFAAAATVTVPTGPWNAFYGEADPTFRPRVVAVLRLWHAELAMQVGAVIRAERTLHDANDRDGLADLHIGQQLTIGLGARVAVWRGLSLDATLAGLVGLTGSAGEAQAPIELMGGAEYRFARLPIVLVAAVGRGLTDGYGAPDARLVLGARWQPIDPGDRDGDGLLDPADACPDVAGPRENHGCPDVDRDGDGLIDRLDRCPLVAGPKENGGCPDVDSDADGLVDRLDQCPREAGPKENGGCPDTDRDGDTVVDRLDQCVDVAGPTENGGCPWPDRDGDDVLDKDDACPELAGVVDNFGCPDIDTDGDGIVDRLDKCPTEPETFNGFQDEDGCPDKGPVLAVLTDKAIVLKREILFAFGKATIRKASYGILSTVATILTLHPEITLLRIEGHTDNVGKRERNIALSQARAEAVRTHLVEVNGIARERLTAHGFGPDCPIADNKRASGRKKNRRSELIIVEKASR